MDSNYFKALLSKIPDDASDDPQADRSAEGAYQLGKAVANSQPVQNVITGKGLQDSYNNALSAAKGDEEAQMRVAQNSLGTAMGSLSAEDRLANAKDMGFDTNTTYYHGTKNGDIKSFDTNKAQGGAKGQIAGFFTKNPDFANEYAVSSTRNSANVLPVHLAVNNTFDYANPEHLDQLFDALPKVKMKEILKENTINGRPMNENELSQQLKMGNWNYLEHPEIIKAVKNLGYDSMRVAEDGEKNMAVFDPKHIRSKFAEFDPAKADSTNLSHFKGGVIQKLSDGGSVHDDLGFKPSTSPHDDLGFTASPKPTPEISKLESGLRGAAQGATFGFAPAISGAVNSAPDALQSIMGDKSLSDLLESYRKNRDASKANFKQAEDANPKTYMAGNVAGALAPALLTGGASEVASIPGLSPAVSSGLLTGAKIGGFTGLGQSDADLTKGEIPQALGDVAKGAIGGAALGGVSSKLGSMLPESLADKFSSFANERALKATGIGKSQLKNIILNDMKTNAFNSAENNAPEIEDSVQKMGRLLLDKNPYQDTPVVSGPSSVEDVLANAQDLKNKAGKDIGDLLSKFDEHYDSTNNDYFDPKKIGEQIQTELLDPLKVNGEITPVSGSAANTVQNVLDTLKRYGNNPIPFEQAQQLKQLISKITNYETPGSANNQIMRQASGIINSGIEDAADAVTKNSGSDDLLDKYLKAKDLYKTASTAVNAASQKTAGNMVNRDFGLTDYISGDIGAHIGGPAMGIVGGLGNKLSKTYGNSSLATGANAVADGINRVSNTLSKAPKEAISNLGKQMSLSMNPIEQRLGGVLAQASDRDDVGRNALVFSLMQNPTYREILNKHLNNKE